MGQYCKKKIEFLEQCIDKAIWLYWFSAHFHYWWSCVFLCFLLFEEFWCIASLLLLYLLKEYFNNKPLCSKDFFLCLLLQKVPRILFWFRKKITCNHSFMLHFCWMKFLHAHVLEKNKSSKKMLMEKKYGRLLGSSNISRKLFSTL